LNLQGIVNWHPLKPNGLIFGSIFNVFIFTIGIVYRYYQIKVERERLQSEVYNQEKKIAVSIIQAQESERQRIAKDLHDDLGGLLALIKLKLEDLLHHGHNVQKILGELLKLITQACKDVRYISHELMPQDVDEKDLKTMISEVLNILTNQQKLHISYDIGEIPLIPSVVKINIFRIIKELLNNIIKHSEAREADIQIFQDDLDKSLTLMISDDGKGMPTQVLENIHMGLGLKNLQKRVEFLKGNLHIDTGAQGTTIIIIIPEKTLLSEYAETPYHS
jgi:signal transduction histidine kinase